MIDINGLTIGQIKEFMSLINLVTKQNDAPHPFIGKYCIVRCCSAGVHAGYVKEIDGEKVILTDSRRLFSWKGTGVALSGVANGEMLSGQKIDTMNPEIYLTGVIELIPCTEKARVSIHDYK